MSAKKQAQPEQAPEMTPEQARRMRQTVGANMVKTLDNDVRKELARTATTLREMADKMQNGALASDGVFNVAFNLSSELQFLAANTSTTLTAAARRAVEGRLDVANWLAKEDGK